METTFTAKEINIMTITIGLRADKVSKEGNFVAERNYFDFPIGTNRFDIWHWFDELYPEGVAKLTGQIGK